MNEKFEAFTSAVTRAYKCIHKIKSREAEGLGLRGNHIMLMYYLGQNPDGLTGSQLCQLCNEDKAAISRTVVELTRMGYIASTESAPRRKYRSRLILTDTGLEINKNLTDCIARAVSSASFGFDDNERQCFYKVFLTITDNLEAICASFEYKKLQEEGI